MPPKLGSASNPAYAKAADAAYAAAKSGDLSAAAKVAAKFAAADAAYKVSGGKGINYHGKEGAKTYQYAVDLIGATGNKTVVSAAAAKETGPSKLSSFTQTGSKPGGSNPGGMYDKGGEKFLVKGNAQLVQGNVNAAVSDASQQYASIFMGGDAEYEGSRWNGPDALGAYLVLLGYDPDPQRSCFALFVTTANEVIEAMSMHEDDMIDDDTAQLVVDAAVEDGVQALLGVPPQQDD